MSVTSEDDVDNPERLPHLAFSSELTRLEEIARGVLSALNSFEQMANPGNAQLTLKEQVSEFESRLIQSALMNTGGNQRRAAEALGIKPTTLNTKIKRHGIYLTAAAEEGQVEGS